MNETAADLSPRSLFGLNGQVAIVTGATSGLGLASAEALAASGARVAIAGLPDGDPGGVAETLRAKGLDVMGVECDVTDAAQLRSLVDTVVAAWGRIDTVFANAGAAMDEPGAEVENAIDRLDRMFDLHVRSVWRLAELTLPVMAEGGGGSFIVMASLSAVRGNRIIGGYGVTKAANAQLARNLAVQWGDRNIRANAIAPGVIATAFAAPITGDPQLTKARLAKTPLGRFGTVAEVAGAVVWLASPSGAFVSGQTIIIDGGTVTSD